MPIRAPTFGFGFGISVGVSGDLAAIGDSADSTVQSQAGAVYLYDLLTGQLARTIYPHSYRRSVSSVSRWTLKTTS